MGLQTLLYVCYVKYFYKGVGEEAPHYLAAELPHLVEQSPSIPYLLSYYLILKQLRVFQMLLLKFFVHGNEIQDSIHQRFDLGHLLTVNVYDLILFN